MNGKPFGRYSGRFTAWMGAALLAAAGWAVPVQGQIGAGENRTAFAEASDQGSGQQVVPAYHTGSNEGKVVQAGCNTCGGLLGPYLSGGCASCGNGSYCYPGRKGCHHCDCETHLGRMICGLYECLCCPDPCYEPVWNPLADAALFIDAPRPVSQTRLRLDSGFRWDKPDRHEYFWAQLNRNVANQNALVSPTEPQPLPGKGPPGPVRRVDHFDFSLYNEGAAGNIGVFVITPWRFTDVEPGKDECGFGDLTIGTKTLLLDCELLQLSFQFTTYTPTGQAGKGFGTGHVSLEPALLWALKLHQKWYTQGEAAFWIPVAGDPLYTPCFIFHYHFSLNKTLLECVGGEVVLIGTAELHGYCVPGGDWDGAHTDGAGLTVEDSDTLLHAGPGLRLVVCNKFDLGVGANFALTSEHWAEQLYRIEVRYRF